MKKITFLLLLFCVNFQIFSQKNDTVYYKIDWKLGNASNHEYYLIKDNITKEGAFQTFYKSGPVKSSFNCNEFNFDDFIKSKFHSKYKEYTIDGKLMCEGNYDNGIKTGKWVHYYENGEKDYEENYENGVLDGQYISYHENKKIFQKGNISKGKRNGEWITKYYDGNLKSIFAYKDSLVTPICHVCNEYKKCKAIVNNVFKKNEIQSNWTCNDSLAYKYNEDGIEVFFNAQNKDNFVIDLQIPWKEYDDFSIEVTFKNTQNSTLDFGLTWNENYVENTYNQFIVSNEGDFAINNLEDDVVLGSKYEKTKLLNIGPGEENVLKILNKGDKVYYSINGDLVDTQKLINFEGSMFKIIVYNNEKTENESIIIKNFIFKDTEDYTNVENGLETGKFEWIGSGTGFYVDTEGLIVTNYHVVEDAPEVWIKCKQNGTYQKFKAEVLQKDIKNDLALIKITDPAFIPLASLPYAVSSGTAPIGSDVFSLGYPLADVIGETVKYTTGHISSIYGPNEDVTQYQITVPIQSGNSGGPLFDSNGNIVGVVVSQLNKELYESENVNYAIKSNILKNIIEMNVNNSNKLKRTKTSKLSQVDKIKLFSDYVVMIQTF